MLIRNNVKLILVFLDVLSSGARRGKGLFYGIKFASRRARIHASGAYKQIWRSIYFFNAV